MFAKSLLLLIASLLTVAEPSLDEQVAALEELTARRVEQTGAPGAVFTLIDGNAIVATQAVGLARQGGPPIGTDMVFAAASMTKPLVAVSLLQLEDRGLVELDEAIVTYLPWFAPKGDAGRITVRDLLNHTSGFPQSAGVADGMLARDLPTDDPARFRRIANAARAKKRADDPFEYSNLNYHLLGQIIESVSGQTYFDYIQTNILDPLGMRGSRMNGLPAGYSYAGQHRMIFGMAVPVKAARAIAGAAGGLFTTSEDYARFLLAVAAEDPAILPEGSIDRILAEPSGRYRLGWQIGKTEAYGMVLFHNGWAIGGSSTGAIAPGSGRGFVSFTNAAEGYVAGDTPAITDHPRALAFGAPVGRPRSFWMQRATLGLVVAIMVIHAFWFVRLARGIGTASRPLILAGSALQAGVGLAVPLILPRLFAGDFVSAFDLYPAAAIILALAGGSMVAVALLRLKNLRT